MQIEQSPSTTTTYTGLGAGVKARGQSDKNTQPLFSTPSDNKSTTKAYQNGETSPLSHFLKAAAGTTLSQGLGKGAFVSTPPPEIAVELTEEEILIQAQLDAEKQIARGEAMNHVLNKLGVNGQVTAVGGETVPQSYTSYYVETEGSAKNLFIVQLENGEVVFAETDLDHNQIQRSFAMAHTELGLNDGKVSTDALKKAFATFFGVKEMKDLFLTYGKSFDPKELEDLILEFWDSTKDTDEELEQARKFYEKALYNEQPLA